MTEQEQNINFKYNLIAAISGLSLLGSVIYMATELRAQREDCVNQGIIDDQGEEGPNYAAGHGCEIFMRRYQQNYYSYPRHW